VNILGDDLHPAINHGAIGRRSYGAKKSPQGWSIFQQKLIIFLILLVAGLLGCTTDDPLPTAVFPSTMIPFSTETPLPATVTAVATLQPTATLPPSPTPCATPGRIKTGSFPSLTAGTMAYRVYLPPCYGLDGRSYPTLYLLPGNGHTNAIWDSLGVDEVAEAGIIAKSWPPFLIVMPDGGWIAKNSSGGTGSYESVILNDLLPFVEQTYCAWADAAGRAIGGMSRGGYWALEIAFRFPEQFGSVGGHSASLLDQYAGPSINPQFTGISQDLGDLRIYLDIGVNDSAIHNIRQLHNDMETAVPPIPHTWLLNEGGHENSYWQSHIPDYLTWYTIPWSAERSQYPICTS
jgi:enterochelin esterase-like enzyme